MDIISILLALGIIGFFALVSAILYLFTSFGKNVTTLATLDKTPAVTTQAFLANIATSCGGSLLHFPTDSCQILNDNTTYFKTLLADIRQAKTSIVLLTYVWKSDEYSAELFDSLCAAAQRQVVVRLLVDAEGGTISAKTITKLREAGVEIYFFRPFEIGKLSLYISRVHRRAFLIDGTIGYFGGMSLSKRWFKTALDKDYVYTDIMYRTTGEAVAPIASTFGELWSAYSGTIAQDLVSPDTFLNRRQSNAFSLSHSPRQDVHPLTYAFWYAIMCAKEEIIIVNPYFIPGKAIAKILCQKAQAGVRVKIITQGTSETRLVQASCRSYYQQLLTAGVEIYEHQQKHLHTKVLVVDSYFTIAGSANLDLRSQRINLEFIIGIQSAEFATKHLEIITSYQTDLKQINRRDWVNRPWYRKLIQHTLHLFSEQL